MVKLIKKLKTRIEGMLLIVESRLSVNLTALTLEQVLNKRQKLVMDMSNGMVLEVRAALAGTGVEQIANSAADVSSAADAMADVAVATSDVADATMSSRTRSLAVAVASEWDAQVDSVQPSTMPLTSPRKRTSSERGRTASTTPCDSRPTAAAS